MKKLILLLEIIFTVFGFYVLAQEEPPFNPCYNLNRVEQLVTEPDRQEFNNECSQWCSEKSCSMLRTNIGAISGDGPNKFYKACVCE